MVTEEEAISVATPQKNESQHSAGHALNSDQDGNTPAVPKKPSEDGYSWRKYGQKNVKRNEFIRSYYKCSYHSCQVKKQVEHAHDGRITDTTYFGEHDHPKPQNNLPITVPSVASVKVQIAEKRSSTISEDKSSSALALTTEEVEPMDTNKLAVVETSTEGKVLALPPPTETKDDDNRHDKLPLKRRKKGTDDAEHVAYKHVNQSCHVVETVSAVDIVNDGYRWRKYGQKLVKGNLNPRSYYRCSNPGCPAKKHVERAFRDPKVVITTYEGKHDHDVPPIRTIHPHANSPSLRAPSEPNGAKKSNKPDQSLVIAQDNATVSEKQEVDTSRHVAEEKKSNKPEQSLVVAQDNATVSEKQEVNASRHVAEEKKSDKPDQSLVVAQDNATVSEKQVVDTTRHVAEEKKDATTDPDTVAPTHDSSGTESGSGDQQTPDNVTVVSSCQESNPKERQNPDSEPVSC